MGELQRRTSCDEITQCQSREDGARSGVMDRVKCPSQCKTVKVLRCSSRTEKPLHVLLFIEFLQ